MDELLNELVTRLKEAYGPTLVSVILHGSAARAEQHSKFSDLNVIVVLKNAGVEELRKAGKTIQWWMKQKQPPPLFVSTEEIRCRGDVYPIEFLDIQQSRRVLFGEDIFAAIEVDRANHRRQVEHELSSALLRLRQRYLVLHQNKKDLMRLMVESISSIATLCRHTLVLAGGTAPVKKHEAFDAVAARFGMDAGPFQQILRVRRGEDKPSDSQIEELFTSYLLLISKLEAEVDRL